VGKDGKGGKRCIWEGGARRIGGMGGAGEEGK